MLTLKSEKLQKPHKICYFSALTEIKIGWEHHINWTLGLKKEKNHPQTETEESEPWIKGFD